MKKYFIFIFIVALSTNCKKNSDKKCSQDKAGVSGTYEVTGITYRTSAAATEQDFYDQILVDDCERDDLFIFNSNGTYNFTDAGVKCNPPGDDIGTWDVNGNTMTLDGDITTIQNFNCSELVIIISDYFAQGDQIKLTFTRQ